MFHLPLRNKCWPIGLDIGADSVKMLQLQRAGGELAVCACGRRKFPAEVRTDPARRYELTVSSVRSMLRQQGFRGRKVITALSSSQLGIKTVRMPHLPPGELAEAIRWEAGERFGFEIAPDRVKYLRAGEVRQGGETQDEIIMLAVSEKTVEAHLSMLEEMGLYVEHIDAEPVALFRVFDRLLRRSADRDTVSVVLDIGASAARLVVARGRRIVFIKSIDIGGARLTGAVARQLNLSLEEAAELRAMIAKEHAEDDESAPEDRKGTRVSQSVCWTIHDAIRAEVEELAREIALCLRYCSVTFRGLRAREVVVTGGQAYDRSIVKLLGEQLGIECVVAHPLRGVDVSRVPFGGNRRGMLSEWALCAGLAMRDIDPAETIPETDHGPRRLSA